mgnify:CR=1 FL=1
MKQHYFVIYIAPHGLDVLDLGLCVDFSAADDKANECPECVDRILWILRDHELRELSESISKALLKSNEKAR